MIETLTKGMWVNVFLRLFQKDIDNNPQQTGQVTIPCRVAFIMQAISDVRENELKEIDVQHFRKDQSISMILHWLYKDPQQRLGSLSLIVHGFDWNEEKQYFTVELTQGFQ